MIAGDLALLDETTDETLDSYYRRSPPRALDVDATQAELTEDRHVQSGTAVSTVDATETDVVFQADAEGDTVGVEVERVDASETVASDWIADVSDSGLLAAASTVDTGDLLPFPYDVLAERTGRDVRLLQIDVEALYADWHSRDDLADVWLKGVSEDGSDDDEGGTRIDYHDHADADDEPADLGVGFRVRWGGTIARGVAYASGYVAVYNAATPGEFVSFVEDEILPHTGAEAPEDEEAGRQETLGDSGGETA